MGVEITAAVAVAMQEVALPRRGSAMVVGGVSWRWNEGVYAADNVGVGATTEHAHTWAAPLSE